MTDLNAREALLYAAATTGVYLVAITEALSAFHALTFGGVASAWTAGCVVLLLLNRRTGSAANPVPAFRFPAFFSHKEPFERVLLFLILLSAGLTALVAFVACPTPTTR